MATATTIKLSLADAGVFSSGAREDSAKLASELLQEDMRTHHIFFNKTRFHSELCMTNKLTSEADLCTRPYRPSFTHPLRLGSISARYTGCLRPGP
jgi:hypothetical protein